MKTSPKRRTSTGSSGLKTSHTKTPLCHGEFLCDYIAISAPFLKSREIISISGLRLPLHHTEPSASLLSLKNDGLCLAVGKAQLYPNHPAVSASYTSGTVLSRPSAF